MGQTIASRRGSETEPALSGDPWNLLPPGPRRLLAQAAASEFGKRGFHATTTRDIAERVGMSPAGMYVHYPSKADLLFTIARVGLEAALNGLHAALDGFDTPTDRVRSLVREFTMWHAVHHALARVLQYELRALMPAHYEVIASIRRKTEQVAANELRPLMGTESGLKITTTAILSLGIDVARWYDGAKSPPPDVLGETYADLVLRMLRP